MLHRLLMLVLAMVTSLWCILLSGCQVRKNLVQYDETSEILVYISAETDQYHPVLALENENVLSQIENELDLRINVQRIGTDDLNGIGEFDLLLFDQPILIVPLAESNLIKQIPISHEKNAAYGKYNGLQFGYVFPGKSNVKTPKLLILPEAFERAGLQNIPYTAESFRKMLTVLSDIYQVPLAVCGEPMEGNYFILQGLFGITPTGGNELRVEDEIVIYDKLTQRMENYLSYLHELYMDHLLPDEMLVLSEYSQINMLYNNVSAMAVFTNNLYLKEAVRVLQENGRKVAVADIPVSKEQYEIDVQNHLTGVIGKTSEHDHEIEKLLQILVKISQSPNEFSDGDDTEMPEYYPLFADVQDDAFPKIYDITADNEINLSYLYQKKRSDQLFLIPAFDRIVTERNLDIHTFFEEAKNKWLINESFSHGNIPANQTILRIFNNWYRTSSKGSSLDNEVSDGK